MPGLSGPKPSLHQLLGQMRGLLLFLLLSGLLQPTQGVALVAQWSPQELTSPDYPEPYPNGQAVTTHIRAPEGSNVRLVFVDFDLEGSPGCAKAWVTVSREVGAAGPPLPSSVPGYSPPTPQQGGTGYSGG
ncbi:complement C1r subcomponent-like protein [Dipodomys spectabilis]|uniref:complement C1r subcomponent-like protein n=1 Tax=Dipodomys spectabilis TaxID=105255 RepID=UPI001C545CE4|nr:complement C1r subcomponent-like protein [Dipodomys spectabilis]